MAEGRTAHILRAWRLKENMEEICNLYGMIREKKQELLRMTEDVNILVASANNVKLNANYGNPQDYNMTSFAEHVSLRNKYYHDLTNSCNQLSEMRQRLRELLVVTNADVDHLLLRNTLDSQYKNKNIKDESSDSGTSTTGIRGILKTHQKISSPHGILKSQSVEAGTEASRGILKPQLTTPGPRGILKSQSTANGSHGILKSQSEANGSHGILKSQSPANGTHGILKSRSAVTCPRGSVKSKAAKIGRHGILKSKSEVAYGDLAAPKAAKSNSESIFTKLKNSTDDLKLFYGNARDLLTKQKKNKRRTDNSEKEDKDGFFTDLKQMFSCIRWTYLPQTMGVFVFWPVD